MAIQRITGTNSGLDVDTLVKSAMTPYTARVDKETQNKKVLEYQQEQYKQIMSDASSFYDKYFDILKTGNLMMTSSYQTESFTSSDSSKVTAKGFAGASIDNYTVNVTQLASKATSILPDGATGNKTMTFGSGANLVTLDAFAVGSDAGKTAAENAATTIANYNAKLTAKKTALTNALNATTDTAEKLKIQQQLKSLNVTATYSEFNKGIVFTADQMGEGGFTLDGSSATDKELQGTITKGGTSYTLSGKSNTVNIDNVQFTLKGVTSSTSTKDITTSSITSLLGNNITKMAKEYTLTDNSKIVIADDGTTTITKSDGTTVLGPNETMSTTINGEAMTIKGDGSFTSNITTSSITSLLGDNITTTLAKSDGSKEYALTNGVKISISNAGEVSIKNSDGTVVNLADTIEFTSTDGRIMTIKGDGTFGSNITSSSITKLFKNDITKTTEQYTLTGGSKIAIADDGTKTITKADGITALGANESIEFAGSDGAKITIKGDKTITTQTANQVTLTGTTDVTALKDKIVNFVNDYNTLLKSINTKLFEKRDKDYMPLTEEQKKAMSEDQITSWEKKAQTGLLRRDSDLERIANAMKSAMSSVMSGSGSYLEQIGIAPVKDYTDKNGMFTINEDKLTKALEENATNVKDLFTRDASTTDKGGVLTQLAAALKSEFKTSTSLLAKKAGLVGSSTEYDNTLTKSISEKTSLIKKLNTQLTEKENALYKKYSDLETIMGKLNSQQSSLLSMLGQG